MAGHYAWHEIAQVLRPGPRIQEAGGHPAAYLTEDQIARYEDTAIDRLITGYTPEEELVVILLKDVRRTSAYRLRARLPEEPA